MDQQMAMVLIAASVHGSKLRVVRSMWWKRVYYYDVWLLLPSSKEEAQSTRQLAKC
jgi:hypothetical protein